MGLPEEIEKIVDQIIEFVELIVSSLDEMIILILNNIDNVERFILRILEMLLGVINAIINNSDLIRVAFMITPILPMIYIWINFIESL